MIASECCGSCENWNGEICCVDGTPTIYYLNCSNILKENNYNPRNPIKSKHEKMWEEILIWMHQMGEETHTGKEILSMMGHIEEKYNA